MADNVKDRRSRSRCVALRNYSSKAECIAWVGRLERIEVRKQQREYPHSVYVPMLRWTDA